MCEKGFDIFDLLFSPNCHLCFLIKSIKLQTIILEGIWTKQFAKCVVMFVIVFTMKMAVFVKKKKLMLQITVANIIFVAVINAKIKKTNAAAFVFLINFIYFEAFSLF